MYTGYQIYQAERPKSAREQREIDMSNAKLAAAVGRFGRRWPGRRVPGARPGGRRRDARPPAPRPASSAAPGPRGAAGAERIMYAAFYRKDWYNATIIEFWGRGRRGGGGGRRWG